MTDDIFKTYALLYRAAGYSTIPIEPNSKRPAKEILRWDGYCNNLPNEKTFQEWRQKYPNNGIGLLLGKEIVNGFRIGAIDVDNDQYVRVVETILGPCPVSKVGKKGKTFFVRYMDKKLRSTTFYNAEKRQIVDVLLNGKMTVLPPSIHPETQSAYRYL